MFFEVGKKAPQSRACEVGLQIYFDLIQFQNKIIPMQTEQIVSDWLTKAYPAQELMFTERNKP